MANYSEVEEELLAQQEEEEERAAALEEQRAFDRNQQPSKKEQAVSAVKQIAKDEVKRVVKDAVKEEALAAASAAGSAIAASAPVWGPILAIVIGIIIILGLVLVVFTSLIGLCNQGGLKGTAAKAASKVSSWIGVIPSDVCAHLTFNGGVSGGAGASGNFDKLDIVLTSAYRPGAIVAGTNRPSAHGKGEAVDIALRNPSVGIGSKDPRIAELLQIVNSVGFIGPPTQQGAPADALDEYTSPTEGASGGHVHIEFNTAPNGNTYCDNTPAKFPPTDLVDIPANIPRSGTSIWKLRQCMLDRVEQIFNEAGSTTP